MVESDWYYWYDLIGCGFATWYDLIGCGFATRDRGDEPQHQRQHCRSFHSWKPTHSGCRKAVAFFCRPAPLAPKRGGLFSARSTALSGAHNEIRGGCTCSLATCLPIADRHNNLQQQALLHNINNTHSTNKEQRTETESSGTCPRPKGPPNKIKSVTPVVGGWVRVRKRTRDWGQVLFFSDIF
jgi:hypothetical protein